MKVVTKVCLLGAFITIFALWNFGGFIPYTPRKEFHAEIRHDTGYLEGGLEKKHKNTNPMQVMNA